MFIPTKIYIHVSCELYIYIGTFALCNKIKGEGRGGGGVVNDWAETNVFFIVYTHTHTPRVANVLRCTRGVHKELVMCSRGAGEALASCW